MVEQATAGGGGTGGKPKVSSGGGKSTSKGSDPTLETDHFIMERLGSQATGGLLRDALFLKNIYEFAGESWQLKTLESWLDETYGVEFRDKLFGQSGTLGEDRFQIDAEAVKQEARDFLTNTGRALVSEYEDNGYSEKYGELYGSLTTFGIGSEAMSKAVSKADPQRDGYILDAPPQGSKGAARIADQKAGAPTPSPKATSTDGAQDSFSAANDNLTDQYQVELLSFMLGLAGVESGGSGNPTTAESVMNSGGRGTAKGIFQFLDTTWQGTAKGLGIKAPRANEATAEEQWRVAGHLMTEYYRKLGSWDLVATAWFAGESAAKALKAGDQSVLKRADAYDTTVEKYISKVTKGMQGHLASGVNVGGGLFSHAVSGAQSANHGATTPLDGAGMGGVTGVNQTTDGRLLTDSSGGDIGPGSGQAYAGDDGATVPGTSGDKAIADTNADGNVDDDEVRAYIERNFAQISWALDLPEVGDILRKAANEDWDRARIYGALIQTNWWKDNPQSTRTLQNLRETDPATWNQMVAARVESLHEQAKELGWAVDPTQLEALASESLNGAWTDAQIRTKLIAKTTIDIDAIERGEVGGEVANNYSNLSEVANKYLIQLAPKEKSEWIKKLMSGTVSLDSFEQYAQEVAQGQFPWAQKAIDRGIDPRTYVRPYQNWVAQTLEISPDSVDVAGKYRDVIWDADGERMRSLPELQSFVKKNYRNQWRATSQAHEQYASLGQGIARMFGKVG